MLKASTGNPVEMYIHDFDGNGTPDQVICTHSHGQSFPIASLDELVAQIPSLKQAYPSYAAFGNQSMEDIFGEEAVHRSIKKSAVVFASCLFLNQGDGTFTPTTLPREIQFSPVRDLQSGDFNRDGLPDLVLTGSNYAARPSLGRQDAGSGWFMPSAGTDNPNVVLPNESGLRIPGDSRKLCSLMIGENRCLIAGINGGKLQVFKIRVWDEQGPQRLF